MLVWCNWNETSTEWVGNFRRLKKKPSRENQAKYWLFFLHTNPEIFPTKITGSWKHRRHNWPSGEFEKKLCSKPPLVPKHKTHHWCWKHQNISITRWIPLAKALASFSTDRVTSRAFLAFGWILVITPLTPLFASHVQLGYIVASTLRRPPRWARRVNSVRPRARVATSAHSSTLFKFSFLAK